MALACVLITLRYSHESCSFHTLIITNHPCVCDTNHPIVTLALVVALALVLAVALGLGLALALALAHALIILRYSH